MSLKYEPSAEALHVDVQLLLKSRPDEVAALPCRVCLQRHPEAGSSWPSWPKASYAACASRFVCDQPTVVCDEARVGRANSGAEDAGPGARGCLPRVAQLPGPAYSTAPQKAPWSCVRPLLTDFTLLCYSSSPLSSSSWYTCPDQSTARAWIFDRPARGALSAVCVSRHTWPGISQLGCPLTRRALGSQIRGANYLHDKKKVAALPCAFQVSS